MADVGWTRSMKLRTAGIRRGRKRMGLLLKRTSACRCPREEVSAKLEVLKKLVPSTRDEQKEEVEVEELFRETADYILRLKAQVVLLQNLIHIYENKTMAV